MKKTKRIIACGLLLAMCMTILAGCGNSNKSASTTDEKAYTMRIAVETGYAPFNYVQNNDSNGAVKMAGSPDYVNGYDILVAKKICDFNGWNLEVYKVDWDSIILGLNSNKYDAIFSGMLITDERKQAVNFSTPYYHANDCLLVRKDSTYASITTLAEAKGSKVVTQVDTMWDSAYIDQIEDVNHLTPLQSVPEIIVAVQSGKADFGLLDTPSCMSACATNADLTYIEFEEGKGFVLPEGQSNDMGIAVRKDDEDLLKGINNALADFDTEMKQEYMQKAVDESPAMNAD